jgi:hypothetical protein
MKELIPLLGLSATESVIDHDKILGSLPLERLFVSHPEHSYTHEIVPSELKIVVEHVEHGQHLEDDYE